MDSMDIFIHNRQPIMNYLARRSGSSSGSNCGPNPCEKPTSSSTFTLPIILGVAVPLVGAAILFMILQRRHTRKIREEDANDRHASLDFGLGDPSNSQSSQKGSIQFPNKEKSGLSRRQVSMDMTMSNPYLLSLESKNSIETLDSLSLPLRKEDPYRPVSQFLANDTTSSRSPTRSGSSANSATNQSQTRIHDTRDPSPNSFTNSGNRSTAASAYPPRYNSLPYQQANNIDQSILHQNVFPTELPQAHIQHEPTIPTNGWASGRPLNQQLQQQQFLDHEGIYSPAGDQSLGIHEYQNINQNHVYDPTELYERESSHYMNNTSDQQEAERNRAHAASNNINELRCGAPDSSTQYTSNAEYINEHQYSMETQEKAFSSAYDACRSKTRLSVMGVRPLPPNAVTDSDDPEIRANRIRSFYKEYFDDSTPVPNSTYEKSSYQNQDEESVYYDPDSNQFVLPYSQPITRRAMTPPPASSFTGLSRPRNGSMGPTNSSAENRPPYNLSESRLHNSSSRDQQMNFQKPTLPFLDLNQIPTPGYIGNDVSNMNNQGYVPPMVYRGQTGDRSGGPHSEKQRIPNLNSLPLEASPLPSPHLLEKTEAYSSLNFAPPKKFRETDCNSDAGSIRSNNSGKASIRPGMSRNGSYRVDHLPEDVVFSKDCLNSSLKPQWDMSR